MSKQFYFASRELPPPVHLLRQSTAPVSESIPHRWSLTPLNQRKNERKLEPSGSLTGNPSDLQKCMSVSVRGAKTRDHMLCRPNRRRNERVLVQSLPCQRSTSGSVQTHLAPIASAPEKSPLFNGLSLNGRGLLRRVSGVDEVDSTRGEEGGLRAPPGTRPSSPSHQLFCSRRVTFAQLPEKENVTVMSRRTSAFCVTGQGHRAKLLDIDHDFGDHHSTQTIDECNFTTAQLQPPVLPQIYRPLPRIGRYNSKLKAVSVLGVRRIIYKPPLKGGPNIPTLQPLAPVIRGLKKRPKKLTTSPRTVLTAAKERHALLPPLKQEYVLRTSSISDLEDPSPSPIAPEIDGLMSLIQPRVMAYPGCSGCRLDAAMMKRDKGKH